MMVCSIYNLLKQAFGLFSDEEFKRGFERCVSETKTGDKLKLVFTKLFLQYSLNIPPIDSEVEGIFLNNFYFFTLKQLIIIAFFDYVS